MGIHLQKLGLVESQLSEEQLRELQFVDSPGYLVFQDNERTTFAKALVGPSQEIVAVVEACMHGKTNLNDDELALLNHIVSSTAYTLPARASYAHGVARGSGFRMFVLPLHRQNLPTLLMPPNPCPLQASSLSGQLQEYQRLQTIVNGKVMDAPMQHSTAELLKLMGGVAGQLEVDKARV